MQPAIETTGLTKRYGETTALDALDLTVERGEVFGFLGPNGAGKTTTIDLLLDFIRPTEGRARILGYDTQEETDAVRERVGILPDGFDLWERSTGYRHLEFALDSNGGSADPDALLDRVGLDREDANRPVGDYSKGMCQRLAMAMALSGDPDVLIMDEPSSGLDPHGIRLMQGLVREEAASGTTVFFSSHVLGQVAAVCDRVGILDEGRLVDVDTLEGLRETTGIGSSLVIEVEGGPDGESVASDDFAAVEAIEGVTNVSSSDEGLRITYGDPRAKARAVHRLVEMGLEVADLGIEEATLDDLFSAVTGSADRANPTRSTDGPSTDGPSTDGPSTDDALGTSEIVDGPSEAPDMSAGRGSPADAGEVER